MQCEKCDNNEFVEKEIAGHRVYECQMCWHIQGDAEAVKKVNEIKEAEMLSMDPMVYPLYKLIGSIPTFKMEFSCAGYPHEKVPPYFTFAVGQKLQYLERMAEALVLANKDTEVRWVIEATFQKRLVFILKPNFQNDPYSISAEQIIMAQKDIPVLWNFFSKTFEIS